MATEGAEAFYRGKLGQTLLDDIAREGQPCCGPKALTLPEKELGSGHQPQGQALQECGCPQGRAPSPEVKAPEAQSLLQLGPAKGSQVGHGGLWAWSWPPSQSARGRLVLPAHPSSPHQPAYPWPLNPSLLGSRPSPETTARRPTVTPPGLEG